MTECNSCERRGVAALLMLSMVITAIDLSDSER